jgi:hypothetical protein
VTAAARPAAVFVFKVRRKLRGRQPRYLGPRRLAERREETRYRGLEICQPREHAVVLRGAKRGGVTPRARPRRVAGGARYPMKHVYKFRYLFIAFHSSPRLS